MKIRNGFVSNSSSSSFVCSICGKVESGYNLCLSDMDWVECDSNDYHTLCDGCLDKLKKTHPEKARAEMFDGRNLKEEFCPHCQAVDLSDRELRLFLTILSEHTDKQEILRVIRDKWPTKADRKKALKEQWILEDKALGK